MLVTHRFAEARTAAKWLAIAMLVSLPFFSGCGAGDRDPSTGSEIRADGVAYLPIAGQGVANDPTLGTGPGQRGDQFDDIVENRFTHVSDQPLSTFSADVDTASYAKARMYLLNSASKPPAGAVRIEEFVNYFPYDYPPPAGEQTFAVNIETAPAPWHQTNQLVRIAIKGKEVNRQRPPCNLVFLIDVSGSMDHESKLPLVKQGLRLLSAQLEEQDRVSIVVYAGAAGTVLPPVKGNCRKQIQDALSQLHAGGSTNGGQGIHLAYSLALDNFIPNGINRVLLCSDGDFNVGTTSTGGLIELAEKYAQREIFLSVLGCGLGNHNDAMMEELSNKANGNYAFIDSAVEARKVLAEQIDSTLLTIAKDVKLQVEFNPAAVSSYRLIGYENRYLQAHEFNDDQRDAGEVGAGHCVTAFYEVALAESESAKVQLDPLRYQTARQLSAVAESGELLTVRVRYKPIDSNESKLIEHQVTERVGQFGDSSVDYRFAQPSPPSECYFATPSTAAPPATTPFARSPAARWATTVVDTGQSSCNCSTPPSN